MPQQERAQATRDAIVRAAAVEFDQVGYAATSLSSILRRSGVTKGAFYFHFPSKQAVADDIARRQRVAWPKLQARWRAQEPDPLRSLIGQVREVVRRLAADPILRAGVRLSCDADGHARTVDPPYLMWEQAVTAHLLAAEGSGLLRDGVQPDAVARVLLSAMVGVRVMTVAAPGSADLVTRSEEVWELVLPVIADPDWFRAWSAAEPSRDPEAEAGPAAESDSSEHPGSDRAAAAER